MTPSNARTTAARHRAPTRSSPPAWAVSSPARPAPWFGARRGALQAAGIAVQWVAAARSREINIGFVSRWSADSVAAAEAPSRSPAHGIAEGEASGQGEAARGDGHGWRNARQRHATARHRREEPRGGRAPGGAGASHARGLDSRSRSRDCRISPRRDSARVRRDRRRRAPAAPRIKRRGSSFPRRRQGRPGEARRSRPARRQRAQSVGGKIKASLLPPAVTSCSSTSTRLLGSGSAGRWRPSHA